MSGGDDIQTLVDNIADELAVAVSLVDPEERHLAHTAHDDVVIDDVRREGILHRSLTAEARRWFEQWGYKQATQPLKTPADQRLGILARWCIPVRFRDTPLGYMWLIPSRELTEDALAPAMAAANDIAAILYRRRLLARAEADLLRLLLLPNPESERMASEVRSLGTYTHKGPVAVMVISPGPEGEELSADARGDLSLLVNRVAEHGLPGSVLSGVISDVGALLAPLREHGDLSPARRLAEKARRFARLLNVADEPLVAIGNATDLEHAVHSYSHARRTLRMMRATPDLGPIVAWDDLGVFRALAYVPAGDDDGGVLDPRVTALLADEGLAATAETFLDLAGNVQETAAQLYVHRTTLYQRLDRIAALYGLDLRHSGDHRLIVHLGLKLYRVNSQSTRG